MASATQTTPRKVEVHAPAAMIAPPPAADPAAWAAFYDEIYRDAAGDIAQIRWADGRPNPALQAWLNDQAPELVRPGASAVVVGCGLGDDARELAGRGYEVTAFDVSPVAIDWARRRHPDISDRFTAADLFSLPQSLLRRADLVVEIYTIQSMHPDLRRRAAAAIASLARPRGAVLTICRARDESEPLAAQPPFALCKRELLDLMSLQGLSPCGAVQEFTDAGDPPARRILAAFRRS